MIGMATQDATPVTDIRRGWIRRLAAECFSHRRTAVGALAVTAVAALIACSPATPAPMMKALAAGTVPAAVIIMGKPLS